MASIPNGAAALKALMGDVGRQFKVVNGMGAKQTVDKTAQFAQAVKDLVKMRVLVGIPEDKGGRDSAKDGSEDGGLNNAARLYIHEHGDSAGRIPARPTVYPGINDAQARITRYFLAAGRAALANDGSRVIESLNSAGAAARDAIKARINSDTPPPLSENYVRRLGIEAANKVGRRSASVKKIMKSTSLDVHAALHYAKIDAATQHFRTLLRSGQMRNAVTYVVEQK